MKKIYTVAALLFASLSAQAQNVGIGTASPNPSAKLEVVDANRGFLFPRVSLTATNAAGPVTSPANWLVVFNTATAGAGATAVSPGLYYWDGTQWVRFQAGNTINNWQLLGNAGTNAATNFIGTTDAVDFVTRTSNAERMRVTSVGNVGIGTNAPASLLHVMGNGLFEGASASVIASTDGAVEIFRNNPGSSPTSFGYIDFKDNNADDYDMRVELRSYTGNNHLVIGNNVNNPPFAISQNLANVGVNVTNPNASSQLEIAATNRGVLIPRIALTANNVAAPITTPATSLLVYNTATVVGANAVSPGFYYWNGTMWLRLTDAVEDAWKLGGNALAGPRSIGSTNAQPVQFLSNNVVRGQINPADGEFVWGATASPYAGDALCAVATAATTFAVNGYSAQNGSGTWGEVLAASGTNFSAVQGVYGGTGSGSGVLGNYNGTNTANTRAGVSGVCSTPTAAVGGAGVRGNNSIASGNMRMGVLGQYATTAWGIGVHGIGAGGGIITGNNDVAVAGWRANNQDYSGYFNGNHVIANGTKSASVPTSKGNQLLYCMESPEVWFEDFGTAQLQNGEAEVKLDEMYLETVLIDDEHPMHVFVQVQGECNDVYVVPNKTGFTVKEKQGGRSNVKFSYRLVAKRLHFPDHRFGNDPVWGEGDTRQYSERAPKRAVDYNEKVKQDLEAKRNWKPTPSPAVTYPDELNLNLTKESALKVEK